MSRCNRFFIIITFLCLACAAPVHAAETILISANKPIVTIGEQEVLSVYVTSPEQAMNAVSGTLTIPGNVSIDSISNNGSIVDFWTQEPHQFGGVVKFEGIVLNPGYTGDRGVLFTMAVSGKKTGTAGFALTSGTILANDGLGSNILDTLGTLAIKIVDTGVLPGEFLPPVSVKPVALPVITDYSPSVGPEAALFVHGKGEPGALTKIIFKDTSFKSIGEQFIASLQTKRRHPGEVLVKNDPQTGDFRYDSPPKLVAGAYVATPFLVDERTNTDKPGLGVQLFVSDSKLVKVLVLLINVLALLIPVVGLGVLIYFIPWYSFRRMRVIRRKLGLEEDKLELSRHQLKREDTAEQHGSDQLLAGNQSPSV